MVDLTRRRLLVGAVSVGTAGCLSGDEETTDEQTPTTRLTGSTQTAGEERMSTTATPTAPTTTEGQANGTVTGRQTTVEPSPTITGTGVSNEADRPRLFAPDGADRDDFGASLALSADGRTALIGAPQDSTADIKRVGSVYAFDRTENGWRLTEKLRPRDPVRDGNFGRGVALSGDGQRALIGMPRDGPNRSGGSGRLLGRTEDGWQRTDVLPVGESLSRQGASVDITPDGQTAVLGAPYSYASTNFETGAARVYERKEGSWHPVATLTAPDGEGGDHLGENVAIDADGSTVLLGASTDRTDGQRAAGSVSVFSAGNDWLRTAKLGPDPVKSALYFGTSIALSGDGSTAVIGVVYRDHGIGSAVVFERVDGAWRRRATLEADPERQVQDFGASVALSNDGRQAVVGAPGTWIDETSSAGQANRFVREGDQWRRATRLVPPKVREQTFFGGTVCLSGDGTQALVSAQVPSDRGEDEHGVAYVFEF